MALGLPKTSLGRAFHWMPVERTKTMALKTVLGGMGFLPPPGFLRYVFCGSRCGSGMSGPTKFHRASETSQGLTDLFIVFPVFFPFVFMRNNNKNHI